MNSKSVLMASAAALALTSNAWAGQGDAYVSLFGGVSTLADTGFIHYQLTTVQQTRTVFRPTNRVSIHRTTVNLTSVSSAATGLIIDSYANVGTLKSVNYVNYARQFSGDLGTDGWVIGATLGVELWQGFRGELEAAFRRFDIEDSAVINFASFTQTRTRLDAAYHYTRPITAGTRNDTFELIKTFVSSAQAVSFKETFNTTNASATAEGELAAFSFMANIWYDFPLGNTGLVPFVGVGIGVANLTLDYRIRQMTPLVRSHMNYLGTVTITPTTGPSYTISPTTTTTTTAFTVATDIKEDDAVFAYQFGAGLGYEFNNGFRLSAQYRYFATGEADFGASQASVETSDIIIGLTFPLGGR